MSFSLVCCGPQSRTGVGVGSRVGVDVEHDTRIGPLIKASASNTASWSNCAASGDPQVDALGICKLVSLFNVSRRRT